MQHTRPAELQETCNAFVKIRSYQIYIFWGGIEHADADSARAKLAVLMRIRHTSCKKRVQKAIKGTLGWLEACSQSDAHVNGARQGVEAQDCQAPEVEAEIERERENNREYRENIEIIYRELEGSTRRVGFRP